MKTILVVALTLALQSICRSQEPGTIPWTPVIDTGLVKVTISVDDRFQTQLRLDSTIHNVSVPKGWSANIFYAGNELDRPRSLAWGPDSILYVANMSENEILALPDRNRDGIAERSVVALRTNGNCHSIQFYRDTMFIGQETWDRQSLAL